MCNLDLGPEPLPVLDFGVSNTFRCLKGAGIISPTNLAGSETLYINSYIHINICYVEKIKNGCNRGEQVVVAAVGETRARLHLRHRPGPQQLISPSQPARQVSNFRNDRQNNAE